MTCLSCLTDNSAQASFPSRHQQPTELMIGMNYSALFLELMTGLLYEINYH